MTITKFNGITCLLMAATATARVCQPNGPECGNYSIARVIENDNTALGDFNTVGGGLGNHADDQDHAVVGGGLNNTANGDHSVISGGEFNHITVGSAHATINGGRRQNMEGAGYTGTFYPFDSPGSVITGGVQNGWISGETDMVVSGGQRNLVGGRTAVITGGLDNVATGLNSVILGGQENIASGDFSTVPGGFQNIAAGKYSVAIGEQAQALEDNSMAINMQGRYYPISTTEPGQFLVQAQSYRLQLTNNPGKADENVIQIDADNIGNLQGAIDREAGRRRELRPHIVEHTRKLNERRRLRMETEEAKNGKVSA